MKSDCVNDTAKLLSLCGQIAEHESAMMRQHNISDDTLFRVLDERENKELHEILSKLYTKWESIHKAHKNK